MDAHPNACRFCHGQGGRTYHDRESGPEWIQCKHCAEQGLCAVCGGALTEDQESHCSSQCEVVALNDPGDEGWDGPDMDDSDTYTEAA